MIDPTGQLVTLAGHLEMVKVEYKVTVEVLYAAVDGEAGVEDAEIDPVSVAVTGQMVVYISTISVVTEPIGQLVMLAGHLETVWLE